MEPLHYSSLRDVARRIQSREISPVELTTRMLDRIAAIDPKLRSYATVMREQALEAAKRAEEEVQRGRYRGPLHGVPIAVKDLCYTKGVRTMAGTSIYAGFLPDHDATVVTRLSQAGAILLGKLNLTEGVSPTAPERFREHGGATWFKGKGPARHELDPARTNT